MLDCLNAFELPAQRIHLLYHLSAATPSLSLALEVLCSPASYKLLSTHAILFQIALGRILCVV